MGKKNNNRCYLSRAKRPSIFPFIFLWLIFIRRLYFILFQPPAKDKRRHSLFLAQKNEKENAAKNKGRFLISRRHFFPLPPLRLVACISERPLYPRNPHQASNPSILKQQTRTRLGDEERRPMDLVPAPAVRLMKRRVLSRPGVNSLKNKSHNAFNIFLFRLLFFHRLVWRIFRIAAAFLSLFLAAFIFGQRQTLEKEKRWPKINIAAIEK